MKRFILLLAIAWFGACLPRTAVAEVTVDLFYDQLAPYGDWVDAGEYGYAWHPRDVGEDWRPYADGRWAYTDAGWTWVSEEPYSWAVYHYGRWTRVAEVGWIWVPGREWGPAWVSFRRSNHYVGWAPLPPEATFGREVRTISTWSDSYYDVGPTQYTFVEVRNFGAPRLREYIAPQRENVTIINETTNITNIRFENNGVYNGGPEYDVITRETAQPIQRLRLDRRTDVVVTDRSAFRSTVQGDSLRVAAPVFQASSTNAAPAKIARKIAKVEVNHGWRDAGDPAATEQLRTKMKAEAQVPAGLPAKPTFQRTSATAAAGAPTNEQPARTPKTTAETAATPSPQSPGASSGKPTSSSKPTSKPEPTATTDPNSPPAGASAEKSTTPRPNAGTAKGKKGQRAIPSTPAPTAASDPNSPPAGASTEKSATPQPNAGTAKGRKGQHGIPTTPAPTTSTDPNNTPAGVSPEKGTAPQAGSGTAKGKKGQRGTAATPSPQTDSAPANTPKARQSESTTPVEPAPQAKPQRKEPKAPSAEAITRPNPGAAERAPQGAEAKPKEREPAKKMESAPPPPPSHQPKVEPQPTAPRGNGAPPAPANQEKKKDEKKGEKKDEKKPEGAPQ